VLPANVARWYEALQVGPAEVPANRQLMREVNHATGNLVHRMFYWAELLGDAPPREDAREAVENLKTSLAELHRLVTRSLDLVREVEVRPVDISVVDLVLSIAMRFGTEPDWSESGDVAIELSGRSAAVDPLVVDRGVGLIAEAMVQQGKHVGTDALVTFDVSPLLVRYARASAGSRERDGVFLHFSVSERDSHNIAPPTDRVDDAVAFTLARKLLNALGWALEFDEADGERRLVLFVPLAGNDEASVSLTAT
jgi:hypothetical protein